MGVTEAELNERILREKHLVAMEVQTEAWADGVSEGIEPEILATAGMETILSKLVSECGPEAASALLESMCVKFEAGVFHLVKYRN